MFHARKSVFLFTVLILTAALPFPARAVETQAKQAFMMDFGTGTVLMEKNPDEKMPTSSMSKVMTMYVVFDALKNGKLALDSTLPVSEKAWRMQGSKTFVEIGKQVRVEDLVRGVVVQSGNDATIVLAEGLAGSEEAFADMMNAKAHELGMENSHFMNASGWPDPQHYSTARDLAILTVAMIRNFPDYYHYFAELDFTYHNIKQGNRNPLLYRNIGADGVKTGHTEAAGYGLIGSGVSPAGRRVVMVLNGLPDSNARTNESARLLEWGLKNFENVKLFAAGGEVEKAAVIMGKSESAPMVVGNDVFVTVPATIKNDLKVQAIYSGPLEAPVRKGQKVGVLSVEIPNTPKVEIPLLAGADVGRLGFFAGAVAKGRLLLTGGPSIQ